MFEVSFSTYALSFVARAHSCTLLKDHFLAADSPWHAASIHCSAASETIGLAVARVLSPAAPPTSLKCAKFGLLAV